MARKKPRRNKEYDIHHTIWVCNSKTYKVQEEINKQLVEVLDHRALNKISWEVQEPQWQMRIMSNKFGWRRVMSDVAGDLGDMLIDMEPKIFYHHKLLR